MTKLKNHGKSTSQVEVLNISTHGIWLYVSGREYFLPHKDFPWFRSAPIAQIQDVKLLHAHHLHWPRLDIDLELESLNNQEKYSLLYR